MDGKTYLVFEYGNLVKLWRKTERVALTCHNETKIYEMEIVVIQNWDKFFFLKRHCHWVQSFNKANNKNKHQWQYEYQKL